MVRIAVVNVLDHQCVNSDDGRAVGRTGVLLQTRLHLQHLGWVGLTWLGLEWISVA